jgi:MFS superfamily sulfate permease-like transporter
VYRFDADLFFANADHFSDEILAMVDGAPSRVNCVVIDAGAITDLDYSAARTLRALMSELSRRRVRLIFARASQFLRADLARHGVAAELGSDCIFSTLHEGVAAAQECRSQGATEARQATASDRPGGGELPQI